VHNAPITQIKGEPRFAFFVSGKASMFDFFRNNIKFLMALLMLLIIPSFVLFGVEGYSGFRDNPDVVARVGKLEITRQEWDTTHRNEIDRALRDLPNIDRSLLDTPDTRFATLERMVNDRVLALAAEEGLFLTTDQRLARELANDPNIAALRDAEGRLDVEAYRRLLAAQGMSPEMFENSVRMDLARRQVSQGVTASGFVPAGAAQPLLRAFFERREIQVANFAPAAFRAQVQVTDADVQAFYDQNPQLFQNPEQVDVEYLVLNMDAVAKEVAVDEAELRAYYEQNNASLATQEERRARHILLTLEDGASDTDIEAVRTKAQGILDQIKADPARFEALAREFSQDPGSAEHGGDLDFFGRGAMVPEFEQAAFALERNAVSGLVRTDFGFHIIQVTDIRRPEPQPFEAVRDRLARELRGQQAQRQFAEAAETFTNLVFEQADSLQPAGTELNLTVRRSNGVLRAGAQEPGADRALTDGRVLTALFSEESLRSKRNIEAVELGGNTLASARVLEYRPAATRPLAEVADDVRERLVQQRASELAATEGRAQLERWKASADAAPANAAFALSAPRTVARDQASDQPGPVIGAALSAPAPVEGAPSWASLPGEDGGLTVVRVNRVMQRPQPSEAQARQEASELGQMLSQVETRAYLQTLRNRFKTEILVPKPATATL
jgi:peptidyl-prolyl cis-trans isomerase D